MIKKGLTAQSETTVSLDNMAITLGSGDLQVFATPAMVALMENAAAKAIAPLLEDGQSSVGTEINVSHIKASGAGAAITATAVVSEVDGRKVTFNIGARDGESLIGEGIHTRFIIDAERFMSKIK